MFSEPPVWIIEPYDVRVIENDFLELVCTASGYPSPKTTWSKVTGISQITFDDTSDLLSFILAK